MRLYGLIDEEWECLRPHLPPAGKIGRPRADDRIHREAPATSPSECSVCRSSAQNRTHRAPGHRQPSTALVCRDTVQVLRWCRRQATGGEAGRGVEWWVGPRWSSGRSLGSPKRSLVKAV